MIFFFYWKQPQSFLAQFCCCDIHMYFPSHRYTTIPPVRSSRTVGHALACDILVRVLHMKARQDLKNLQKVLNWKKKSLPPVLTRSQTKTSRFHRTDNFVAENERRNQIGSSASKQRINTRTKERPLQNKNSAKNQWCAIFPNGI